jgi:hypothetical protein
VPDADELYVYSREDYGRILGDAFVDIREVVRDDETAADVVDIVYERLTDDFYGQNDE